MSCQETESGIAWIEFDSMDDFLRFLNIVTRFEAGADTLYNRIDFQLTGDISKPLWRYQVNLLDLEADEPGRADGNMAYFQATIGLYFPHEDLPIILERIQAHNEHLA